MCSKLPCIPRNTVTRFVKRKLALKFENFNPVAEPNDRDGNGRACRNVIFAYAIPQNNTALTDKFWCLASCRPEISSCFTASCSFYNHAPTMLTSRKAVRRLWATTILGASCPLLLHSPPAAPRVPTSPKRLQLAKFVLKIPVNRAARRRLEWNIRNTVRGRSRGVGSCASFRSHNNYRCLASGYHDMNRKGPRT